MKLNYIYSAVVALTCSASAFAGTTIAGTTGDRVGSAYATSFTDVIQTADGKVTAMDQFTLVCIEWAANFPTAGQSHTYSVVGSNTAPVSFAAAGARSADLFNYAVDKFYDTMVLGPNAVNSGYSFSALMWEIGLDFNGYANSLSTSAGRMYAGYVPSSKSLDYTTMVKDLHDNYNDIAQGYRSSKYKVTFLDDEAAGYQSMMMLTSLKAAEASTVPEPGTLALSVLGGMAMFIRNRRQKTAQASGSPT